MKNQKSPGLRKATQTTPVTFPETGNTTPRQKGDCGGYAKLREGHEVF
ncbi:MAG: hypothetical protein ABSH16_01810 [Sedimentisphaerales bacterium]